MKGIDLGPQEGVSPRRMAARQAILESNGQAITLRDLDSPGGTFVNRQRLLPGQSRTETTVNHRFVQLMGRLKPGVSNARAAAETLVLLSCQMGLAGDR